MFKLLSARYLLAALCTTVTPFSLLAAAQADISISEIHYDNDGTDTGEAIELSGPVGAELSGWSLVLYNGSASQRAPYNTFAISGELSAVEGCERGYFTLSLPANGLQNGAPDGIALLDDSANVVQFLSYEGAFEALDGPAVGLLSEDIGVSESSTTPVGYSLQFDYLNQVWLPPAESNFGRCEAGVILEPTPTLTPRPSTEPSPEPAPERVKIHQIQGAGAEVTRSDEVIVEAIVVGVYQGSDQLRGFFIQEEDADSDSNAQTSEGIFVYCGSCTVAVSVGDQVRVTGAASDYYGMSQLNPASADAVVILSSNNPLPSPAQISLPVAVTSQSLDQAQAEIDSFYEAYEGMLVSISSELFATEYYQLGRYGEVVLAAGDRFRQFTDVAEPDADAWIAHQIQMATARIVLDDGSSTQNPIQVLNPLPGLSGENGLRGGASVVGLTGPLHYAYDKWRIQPVPGVYDYRFNDNNPRTEAPLQGLGNLRIASFNVLNYFTTLDDGVAQCGPEANMDCRGANSVAELQRQQDKIVAALCALDADVVGLMELENPALGAEVTPVETLVDALNRGCTTSSSDAYQALVTGSLGSDAISVGIIYRPTTVAKIGTTAVLDDLEFTDPLSSGEAKNRAALAQSFQHLASGENFTVAVNHLKSKGSSCGTGDDDVSTGQGNCNSTRTAAAEREVAWLASHPTAIDTPYQLVIGDLNAYRKEAPINAFKNAGYRDLIDQFIGAEAYGYVFDGQLGYLDHALASEALAGRVVAVADWHINADEINLLDYNSEYKPDNYLSDPASSTDLYKADAYRSSDHDPVIIALDFSAVVGVPSCMGREATIYVEAENGHIVGGPLNGQLYRGTLIGSQHDDVMVGTPARDLIVSLAGDDLVCAGAGRDVLLGGNGRDQLNGGDGRDRLFGGRGKDICVAGEQLFGCEADVWPDRHEKPRHSQPSKHSKGES
ncbi:ExeM/NucH family extracellular endonuclease [Teredinibacter waterburyi]|uniref:ExeM/NucH family extracellular endonuclease n=1 Tax=Teredinibacter waterburyi TaxID=1500538 RepID=UPI00165F06A6|nr:ExeM/NucH family extracellular endonuclease [Teredinibacter waterburyi]